MYYCMIHHLRTFSTEKNFEKNSLTSGNFLGNTLTQSDMIESYRTYCVTSSYPQKEQLHFCQLWWDEKIVLHARPELKFKTYESV